MKKNFGAGQQFVNLLLFAGFLLSASFNIIKPKVEEETAPKLTILKAEWGIFDNKIRHGEFIAFKNSPGISRDTTYDISYNNWLERPTDDAAFILDNKTLSGKNQVFKILKKLPTIPELRIKYNYAITQYTKKFPEYNDDILKEIFESIKEAKDIPLFEYTTDDAAKDDLSPFDKEAKRRATFVNQYQIRNYDINEGDIIQLQVQSTNDFLGADKRYGTAMIWVPEWHAYSKNSDDATTVWSLPKVNKNGPYIENGTKVYIQSADTGDIAGRKIQRFGVTAGTKWVVLRNTPSDSFLNLKENAYFDVYRLGPTLNRLTPEKSPKFDVSKKLTNLFDGKKGLKALVDGINFPNPDIDTGHDWKAYFGNPTAETAMYKVIFAGMNNLWLQLKVSYKLGRRTYLDRIFNEWEENIQIPTDKELKEATNDLLETQRIETNLKTLEFVKAPKLLTQICVNGKQVVGINTFGQILKWNYDKKAWQNITTFGGFAPGKSRNAQVGISSDGTVFMLQGGTLSQVKQDKKTVFDPNFSKQIQAFSLSDLNNLWVIKDGIVFRYSNGKWNQFVKNLKMTYISTAPDKTTYALDKDNIYKWTGDETFNSDGVWEQIGADNQNTPKLKQISVGSEKYVRGVDNAKKAWKWNGNEWEEETLIENASQIAINNLGEIWLLINEKYPEAPGGDLIYYSEKNIWALSLDKFALKSKTARTGGYLANLADIPTPTGQTNLQSSKDENALWSAINPDNANDTGPLTYGSTIVLRSSDNKYMTSDDNNYLLATLDINKATKFTLISYQKSSSKNEISKDLEATILLKSDNKYLTVTKQQAMLTEKETAGLNERWVIEEASW